MKIEALVKANVDAIVIDTAHEQGVIETLKSKTPSGLEVVVGNIATGGLPSI